VKKAIPLLLLGMVLGPSAFASTDTPDSGALLIDGSYIVTFRSAEHGRAGLIAPSAMSQAVADPSSAPKFGEHGTGQSKEALGHALGLRGKVMAILETINAAHIHMDAAEAARLKHHPEVIHVEQNMRTTAASVQYNPGWGLDRLDQSTTALNSQYQYNANGAGQTVYVLDSGLDLTNPYVAVQFGGRASFFWDVNGGDGADCNGHGTQVASAIAGNTHGVAKGAKLVIAKITKGCSAESDTATWATAFNWLAANAPRGTIVNLSYDIRLKDPLGYTFCGDAASVAYNLGISKAVEDAMAAAYNKGVIMVVAAGDDGCNTAYYTPTRKPHAFVVGATGSSRLNMGQDAKPSWSRTGTNISTFAPGLNVNLLNFNGQPTVNSGTSFSAPYVAGLFAVACQYYAPYCSSNDVGATYQQMRAFGTLGTVVNPDGSPLTGATSRFISRLPW
jgi:serine protease